jgi:hypothetical protein
MSLVELAAIRLGLSCSLLVARAVPCKALEILSLHDLKSIRSTNCGGQNSGDGSVVVFNGRMGFGAKTICFLPHHFPASGTRYSGVRFLRASPPCTSPAIGEHKS